MAHVEHVDGIDFTKEDSYIVTKFNVKDALDMLGIDAESADDWLNKMSMTAEHTAKNSHNRPFRKGIGDRYAYDILHNRWPYNGESLSISKTRQIISGQHRLYALIKAEKLRKVNPDEFKQWHKGTISLKVLIATGIDDKAADTTDQGQARAHGDVLFRKGLFDHYKNFDKTDEFKLSDKKKLAKDLGTAIRTVWLRVGGKAVSDAPHFPKSEMLTFLQKHPKILDCVVYVYRQDDGKNKLISSTITRAYMSAAMYLAATSASDREDYDVVGDVDLTNMNDAEDFVESYATGVSADASSPCPPQAIALKNAYNKIIAAGGTRDRDETLNLAVKAFALFLDKKAPEGKLLSIKKDEATPRLGGLDIETSNDDEDEAPTPEKALAKKSAKKAAPKKTTKKNPVAAPVESEDDEDTGYDEDNDD
jgi:hypothetical protein